MWFLGKKKAKDIELEKAEYLKSQMLATNSGMWGIWDYESYKTIEEYEDWESVFEEDEDIIKQIKKGHFVPIYIMSDGACQFAVKRNDTLTEREKEYLVAESDAYLYRTNGKTFISGIEYIEKSIDSSDGIELDLEPGNYEVKIYLIEWEREPGARKKDGSINENVLPDFIVIINDVKNLKNNYRTKVETFEE